MISWQLLIINCKLLIVNCQLIWAFRLRRRAFRYIFARYRSRWTRQCHVPTISVPAGRGNATSTISVPVGRGNATSLQFSS